MADRPAIARVRGALLSSRMPCDTECRLHAAIAAALDRSGLAYEQEVVLSAKDRIDFLVGDVGLEAKIAGGRLAVWRQLERYAEHERIGSLVLVAAIAMPPVAEIKGKPFTHLSVGATWL